MDESVLTEIPIEIMILIVSPYFAAVILTIIYVHNKKGLSREVESSDDAYNDSYGDINGNNNSNSG